MDSTLNEQILSKLDKLARVADEEEIYEVENDNIWAKKEHDRKVQALLNALNDKVNHSEKEEEGGGEEEEEDNDDTSIYTYSTDLTEKVNDEEWESLVLQLQVVIGIVLIPLVGKFLGRRFAHTVWGIVSRWIYK